MVARVKAATLLVFACLGLAARGGNHVVNLSHYDEMDPDFPKMATSGILGVIHEASYPRFARDARYAQRQTSAARAGLLWGAYHFGDATDPERQADHFLDCVAARQSPSLLVLDFEKNDHYPGGTMTAEQAAKFVERIRKKTGKFPGLYSGEYRVRSVLNSPSVSASAKATLTKCWLWIANYHEKPKVTSPWGAWTMWQYTGDGVCELPRSSFPIGIANIKKAERNIYSGTAKSLKSFWAAQAWVP
jgi:lysozyme